MNRIFMLLLLTSSLTFSQKAEYAVINDFLDVELRDYKIDSIHVQIEPLDVRETLQLYEQGYEIRDDQNSYNTTIWVTPELKDWPFSEKDIIDIKNNLQGTDKRWKKSDFKNKQFVFKPGSLIEDRNFKISHIDKGKIEYVLRLSRPVFNEKKDYALFKYYFTELFMGGSRGKNRGAVIMKKQNGKWIALASIREAVYE